MNDSVSYKYKTNINRGDNDIFNRSLNYHRRNSPKVNTSQNICFTEGNLGTLRVIRLSYISV
jgi:hypothetical protein